MKLPPTASRPNSTPRGPLYGRSRLERALVVSGALAVVVAIALWVLVPPPPPTKGLGPTGPRLEVFVAFVAGGFLVVGTVRSASVAWWTRGWPIVPVVLTEVRPVDKPYLFLSGDYTVGDRSYVFQDIRLARAAQYHVGASLILRYDPASPELAALQPLVSWGTATAFMVGAVLLIGGGLALVAPSPS